MPMYVVEELQKKVEKEIGRRISELAALKPAELYSPVKYSLEVGGKRLRPLMLLLSYNLFAEEVEPALPAAVATEVFHNFTLLHDDIMDKAEVRRNKPTVHVKFSENNAILSGDAMAFISYQYLMECRSDRLFEVVELFTTTALQVCEGQQYDMDFEQRLDVTESEYLEMIRLKTAVLLGCCLKAGALLADAPPETAAKLYEVGINLGLAFQVQDDWLDSFGTQQSFGKMIGGDILAGKKTWLLVKALESAEGSLEEDLIKWLNAGNYYAKEKIKSVIEIYDRLGIRESAEEKTVYFFTKAMDMLKSLPVDDSCKHQLFELIKNMQKRSF
ncbi:MAG: polyprenyl synthetase family protein [Mariniphaga sp.]